MKRKFLTTLLFIRAFTGPNAQSIDFHASGEKIIFPGSVNSVTIPFQRYKDWIVLKVKVNNKKTLSLIFDSGAPMNVLSSESIAEELRLTRSQPIMVGDDQGKLRSFAVAVNVDLVLGSFQITNTKMIIGVGQEALTGVDGVIGRCLFQQCVLSVNWNSATITLTKPAHFNYTGTAKRLPLSILNSGHIATQIEAGNKKTIVNSVIDFGNRSGAYIDSSMKYVLADTMKLIKNIIVSFAAHGPVRGDKGTLNMSWAGYNFRDVPFSFRKINNVFTRQNVYCNIGVAILERFDLVINLPGKQLILESNESLDDPFIYNRTGIIIDPKREGDYILIADIIPGSPAFKSGLQVGDKITKANGYIPELEYLSLLDKIITGKNVQGVNLAIQRNSSSFDIKIIPQDLFK